MKKVYQKPNAEYITLLADEAITDIFEGDQESGVIPDDWE